MIPRAIYLQPIRNGGDTNGETGVGANASWLRAIADMEHDDEPMPAWVTPQLVSRSALVADQKITPNHSEAALVEIVRRKATFDPDEIGSVAETQAG